MDGLSYFESRSGKLKCTSEEAFNFVTDIRNFEQFAPQKSIDGWQAERESCSFTISMIGSVNFRLTEKVKFNKVVFKGNALNKNDFSLVLNISGNVKDLAEVKISLSAELNPMLKLMAAKPIVQFLEMLINGMENFSDWKKTNE
jgi:hypothetical protein